MKTKLFLTYFLSILIALVFSGFNRVNSVKSQETEYTPVPSDESVSLETFQDSLSGYGQWIEINKDQIDPNYVNSDGNQDNVVTDENVDGYSDQNSAASDENDYVNQDINTQYIWVPNPNYVYEGWNPYSNGRWIWTDWGWEWASDYSWGWGPYHYGRWWYSDEYGWVWSPGNRWAPSWVDWCYSDGYSEGYEDGYRDGYANGYDNGYIGWCPESPREHHHGDGYGNHHNLGIDPGWVFTDKKNFTKPITPTSIVSGVKTTSLLKNATQFVSLTQDGKKIVDPGPNVKSITNTKVNTTIQKKVNGTVEIGKTDVNTKNVAVTKSDKNNTSVLNKKTVTVSNGNKNNTSVNISKNTNNGTKNVTVTKGIQKNTSTLNNKTVTLTKGSKDNTSINNKNTSTITKNVPVTKGNQNNSSVLNNKTVPVTKGNQNNSTVTKSKTSVNNTNYTPPKTTSTGNSSKTYNTVTTIPKGSYNQTQINTPKVTNTSRVTNTQPKVTTTQTRVTNTQPKVNNSPSVNTAPRCNGSELTIPKGL